jgi:hypothetical protein
MSDGHPARDYHPRRIIVPARREFSLTVANGSLTAKCSTADIDHVSALARQLLGLGDNVRLVRTHVNLEEWFFRALPAVEDLSVVEIP